jgi:hypothetical protein
MTGGQLGWVWQSSVVTNLALTFPVEVTFRTLSEV